jgi:hypothetical protein
MRARPPAIREQAAKGELLIFLDDDVEAYTGLIRL